MWSSNFFVARLEMWMAGIACGPPFPGSISQTDATAVESARPSTAPRTDHLRRGPSSSLSAASGSIDKHPFVRASSKSASSKQFSSISSTVWLPTYCQSFTDAIFPFSFPFIPPCHCCFSFFFSLVVFVVLVDQFRFLFTESTN